MTTNKKQINVSIVIPCYNEAGGVTDSLNEVCKALRKHDDVEIITVNDGSADKTPAILDKYASQKCIWHRKFSFEARRRLWEGSRGPETPKNSKKQKGF